MRSRNKLCCHLTARKPSYEGRFKEPIRSMRLEKIRWTHHSCSQTELLSVRDTILLLTTAWWVYTTVSWHTHTCWTSPKDRSWTRDLSVVEWCCLVVWQIDWISPFNDRLAEMSTVSHHWIPEDHVYCCRRDGCKDKACIFHSETRTSLLTPTNPLTGIYHPSLRDYPHVLARAVDR